MKKYLVFSLLFSLCSISLAQLTKEEKLQQLKSREDVKVTELDDSILKLEYPSGKMLYKNIADHKPTNHYKIKYSPNYDSTIIDLRYIDTTLYYQKYGYWSEVPLHNWDFDHLRIGDVNRNGKPELYGSRKFYWSDFEPVTIYELDDNSVFEYKFQYDSVSRVRSIYDVDKDDQNEVLLTKTPNYGPGNQQRFFSKPTETSFATQLNFIYQYGTGAQLDDITLGDFDGDVFTDMLFNRWGKPYVHILEYNPTVNNFDSVYRFDTQEPAPYDEGGFSVGDFDLDGKTDMVFGTGRGNVFVIEYEGNNLYTNTWAGSVESYHAYIHTPSNDIDKNGKPEFWVLADAYYSGIGTTRITIFETDGDNSYKEVGRVDLVGIFSFYAGTIQAIDIDKDGTEEIAVCIDDNFLILKFNGSQNHHTYEVYYIKQNELAAAGENSVYYGATVYDLKNNGEINLLISMDHIIQNITGRRFTQIYKPDSISSVNKNDFIPNTNKLYQNYPNPFNPATNIRFEINQTSRVTLKVFDLLGKEKNKLLEKELSPGGYEANWEGKDSSGKLLPSGVYLIQLKSGNYTKTIKALLIR
jgi:hypothetical protein